MADKDYATKRFFQIKDNFADLLNGYIFQGEQVVKSEELEDIEPRSHYKNDKGRIREQERDIVKRWKGTSCCIVGIENQSQIDRYMPIRIMSYDAASYADQHKEYRRTHREIAPVFTLVLYFGEQPYTGPTTLLQCIDADKKLPKLFTERLSDYRIEVLDVRRIRKDMIPLFQGDLEVLLDYFWQSSNTMEDYHPLPKILSHDQETLEMFFAFAKDVEIDIKTICDTMEGEQEHMNMQGYFDKALNQGKQIGLKIGNKKAQDRIILAILQKKMLTIPQIMEISGASEAYILTLAKENAIQL